MDIDMENNEDMFDLEEGKLFGLEVEPEAPSVVTLKPEQILLITSACLGETAEKGERAVLKLDLGEEELTVCTLVPFVQENVALDLPISVPSFRFSVAGAKKTNIHLIGRYVSAYDEEEDDEFDEDEDGQVFMGSNGANQIYSSLVGIDDEEDEEDDEDWAQDDEDDDDDEDEDEDDDEKGQSKKVTILNDDDEEDDEEDDDDEEEDELMKKIESKFPGRSKLEMGDLDKKKEKKNGKKSKAAKESESESDDEEEKVQRKASAEKAKRKRESTGTPEASKKKSKSSGSPATPNEGGKVPRSKVEETVKGWLKKEKTISVSDIGSRINREFKTKFKSLGYGSLTTFLNSISGVHVKDGKLSLAKK